MRLNLGSGGRTDEGWVHIDLAPPATLIHDLREPLPFDDNSVDYAVCHHVLDLMTQQETESVLREILRVLEPRAWVRMSGADIGRGVLRAIGNDLDWFAERRHVGEPVENMAATIGWFITQGGARKQWLSAVHMRAMCDIVGFSIAVEMKSDDTFGSPEIMELDSRQEESWFVEAQK